MAERKGLEPSASGVTGRRYNRLNYRSVFLGWWAVQDLNLWPPPCEGGALPAELTAPPGEFEFYANTPSESSTNLKVKKFLQGIFYN